MKKNLTKGSPRRMKAGFTLIELLVVIAIIGILASVILASLNSARAKGVDAAIKSDLDNARAQAELYYQSGTGNTYAAVCATTNPQNINAMMVDAALKFNSSTPVIVAGTAGTLTTIVCHDSVGAWAAAAPLKSSPGQYFCVDSTGASKQDGKTLTSSGAGQYACL